MVHLESFNAIQLFYALFSAVLFHSKEFTLKFIMTSKLRLFHFTTNSAIAHTTSEMFLYGGGDLRVEQIIFNIDSAPSSQCFSHLVYGSKSFMLDWMAAYKAKSESMTSNR